MEVTDRAALAIDFNITNSSGTLLKHARDAAQSRQSQNRQHADVLSHHDHVQAVEHDDAYVTRP